MLDPKFARAIEQADPEFRKLLRDFLLLTKSGIMKPGAPIGPFFRRMTDKQLAAIHCLSDGEQWVIVGLLANAECVEAFRKGAADDVDLSKEELDAMKVVFLSFVTIEKLRRTKKLKYDEALEPTFQDNDSSFTRPWESEVLRHVLSLPSEMIERYDLSPFVSWMSNLILFLIPIEEED